MILPTWWSRSHRLLGKLCEEVPKGFSLCLEHLTIPWTSWYETYLSKLIHMLAKSTLPVDALAGSPIDTDIHWKIQDREGRREAHTHTHTHRKAHHVT